MLQHYQHQSDHIMFGNILLLQTMWKLRNTEPRMLHVCFVTKYSTSRAIAHMSRLLPWANIKQECTHF